MSCFTNQTESERHPDRQFETNAHIADALLKDVRRGEEQAFSSLLAMYRPLLRKMVNLYAEKTEGADREELQQEAVIALYRAACTYCDTRNVTFGLYARICIRNALLSAVRRQIHSGEITLSQPLTDTLQRDPDTVLQEADLIRFAMQYLCRELCPRDYDIFRLYLSGYTYRQIADKMHVSQKQVDNVLFRTKQKLRRFATEHGILFP